MLYTKFDKIVPAVLEKKMLLTHDARRMTDDAYRTTHDDKRQPIVILTVVDQSVSGDLKR